VVTGVFNGIAPSIPVNAAAYQFVGPFVLVTTTAVQRLTGTASAPLGLANGAQTADLGLCYQNNGGGGITNFVGAAYSIHQFAAVRANYSAVGSVVPGAATWRVGMCVRNAGPAVISNNDFVNGWVQVTN